MLPNPAARGPVYWQGGPMKVSRNTPDQLIIENNPIVLAILLNTLFLVFLGAGLFNLSTDFWFGIAFAGGAVVFGAIFNLAFIRRTQILFDRPANLVEMRRKSLLGYQRRTWALEHLDRAEVQSSRSDNTNTYRAALVFDGGMDAGTHPITLVYSSGGGARRAADAINTWLR